MSSDLIADLLTRVRNAQRAGHQLVNVKKSKMVENILSVMKQEGFIGDFSNKSAAAVESGSFKADKKQKQPEIVEKNTLTVYLRYFSNGNPAISSARRMSKSGKRMYVESDALPKIKSGLGISILSTSAGVISDKEARKKKVGGELLAIIS